MTRSSTNTTPGIPPLADRMADAKQTALRQLSARCAELGGVNLAQGICDLPTPVELKRAAQAAIDANHDIYTHVAGIAELRAAIANKMHRFNNITCDPGREIAVTVGSAGAFACVVMAVLDPGDEVVVFSPFYKYYTDLLKLLGVTVRFVHTQPPDWTLNAADLSAACTDRTRMILVNTPANPSGKIFTRTDLETILGVAEQHDAWLVTDEVYEYITYDHPHVSVASLPNAAHRTVTLSGPSKTYAVTGWRVGYAVGPAELIEKICVAGDLLYICAPAPLQYGVVAGLELPASYYADLCADYRTKRDLLAAGLTDAGFTPYLPQGAFYMMADFGTGRFPSAMHAADHLLEQIGVAAVPGAPFYANPADGETQLRFCFAKETADLEEACRRLGRLG